jgi:hypothetical protein
MFEPLEQFEIVFNNSNLIGLLLSSNNFFSSFCLSFCLFVDNFFYVLGISDWSISLFRTLFFFLLCFFWFMDLIKVLLYGLKNGKFS